MFEFDEESLKQRSNWRYNKYLEALFPLKYLEAYIKNR